MVDKIDPEALESKLDTLELIYDSLYVDLGHMGMAMKVQKSPFDGYFINFEPDPESSHVNATDRGLERFNRLKVVAYTIAANTVASEPWIERDDDRGILDRTYSKNDVLRILGEVTRQLPTARRIEETVTQELVRKVRSFNGIPDDNTGIAA